jgi:hypothetical protein
MLLCFTFRIVNIDLFSLSLQGQLATSGLLITNITDCITITRDYWIGSHTLTGLVSSLNALHIGYRIAMGNLIDLLQPLSICIVWIIALIVHWFSILRSLLNFSWLSSIILKWMLYLRILLMTHKQLGNRRLSWLHTSKIVFSLSETSIFLCKTLSFLKRTMSLCIRILNSKVLLIRSLTSFTI